MFALYRLHLFLFCISEFHRSYTGTRAAVSLWSDIDQDDEFIKWLKKQDLSAVAQLKNNVLEAKRLAEQAEIKLTKLEAEQETLSANHAEARAVLQYQWAQAEWEMGPEFQGVVTKFFQPVIGGIFGAKLKEERTFVYLAAAGNGLLNGISVLKLLGVPINRLTAESLILGGMGLSFSVAAMVSISLGLSSYIVSTRQHLAGDNADINENLFPFGWQDKAIWITAGLVLIDSLFSSLGLATALPPRFQKALFYQICIVAISGFGSIVNMLLVWGLSIERIQHKLFLMQRSRVVMDKLSQLEPMVSKVARSGESVKHRKEEVSRARNAAARTLAEAKESFWRWFKQVQNIQRETHISGMWLSLFGSRVDVIEAEQRVLEAQRATRQDSHRKLNGSK
ncbi:MAG: hypothetical protein F6K11_10235 [Leptolyngbya sp. SIO3F4]|nr:hypothetical protein [Leptolyngbya sp. SIO3F4]